MSFSLVAGACCFVLFHNAIASKNSKRTWTLNINSTGAKTAAWYTGYAASGGTVTPMLSTDSSYYTLHAESNPLFVYNGTYYLPIGEKASSYYSDYGDYADT